MKTRTKTAGGKDRPAAGQQGPPVEMRILLRMRELLSQGFCQWSLAKDDMDRRVEPGSPDAVSYCLVGAEMRARLEMELPPLKVNYGRSLCSIESEIAPLLGEVANPFGLFGAATKAQVAWNNAPGRTKEEVLARVDRALARFRK